MKLYIVRGKYVKAAIIGTDEYGMLLLELPNNNIISCDFKEVEFTGSDS